MSPQFYELLHVFSIIVVLMSLSFILSHLFHGGTKENFKLRKPVAILHGVASLTALIAGFGLIAKHQYDFASSPWLYTKLVCWLFVGVFPFLIYRRILKPKVAVVTLATILFVALYAVVFKP